MKKILLTIAATLFLASLVHAAPQPQTVQVQATSLQSTNNTAINTDAGQGLVDPPKYVYPSTNAWGNIGLYKAFVWRSF